MSNPLHRCRNQTAPVTPQCQAHSLPWQTIAALLAVITAILDRLLGRPSPCAHRPVATLVGGALAEIRISFATFKGSLNGLLAA
jgi:hypothetical protein